ncbi:MAG: extracellular solute-binding protein [Polyangiaceae bacterium]|nr:extracellular solute-binding protein [Polyangiaceae bacterium]
MLSVPRNTPFIKKVWLWAVTFFIATFVYPTLVYANPIRLWHAYRGDEEKALLEIIKTFPGGKIETLALPADALDSKLASASLVGEGPDVFIAEHHHLGEYKARSIVGKVGDAFEGEGAFIVPAVRAVTDGDGVWGVPLSPKCMALFVNDDLAKTPADFEAIGELTGKLPQGVFPLVYEARNLYAHAPIFGAFGGELLGKNDQWSFIGTEAETSLNLARTFIAKGAVPDDANYNILKELFKAGKAAFVISGPWLAADLSDAKDLRYHIEVLPNIRGAGQPMRPLLTVESAMLTKQGAEKPEARALAKWLASREAAQVRARLAKTLTARSDVSIADGDPMLRVFSEQAKVAIPMPASRAMQAVWDPANRAISKVIRGEAPPDVALAEAKRRYDTVRRPPPDAASPTPFLIVIGGILLVLVLYWVRGAKKGDFTGEVKRSLPAYAYVIHSVVAVGLLVIAPLTVGAATAFFSGNLFGDTSSRRFVGLANFIDILTAQGGALLTTGSFYVVLLVTLLWTFLNLFFHVTIGVSLALLLSKPALKLKAFYRVLLIVPWAVPSYITALVWKGMFDRQFGAVTGLILGLNDLFGFHMEPISWFARFSTAFTANVSTNVWLGFPVMMVVTLGALTAVPQDVLEAAEVDGATRWQRLWRVTLPMIRPTLAPSVTLGGIWTFNMFNVVFLVSGGDPDGTTDILVSEAYRWAFTREAKYGYAAAYSVLIFLMLFGFTRWDEWRKKRADDRDRAVRAKEAAA